MKKALIFIFIFSSCNFINQKEKIESSYLISENEMVDILYDMFKKGESFENLTKKGNTVPEGKKPVTGIQAAINMRKKFK